MCFIYIKIHELFLIKMSIIPEDGCSGIGNTEIGNFCPSFGYTRITVPTVSGLQTMYQVSQAVLSLQRVFEEAGRFRDNVEKGCLNGINNLVCGLLISHCKAGKVVRPLCREHCQGWSFTVLFYKRED